MVNSFQIMQASEQPHEKPEISSNSMESSPLNILKKRFASGEISEEDYRRMKSVLQEE